jgi:hypothetical protein
MGTQVWHYFLLLMLLLDVDIQGATGARPSHAYNGVSRRERSCTEHDIGVAPAYSSRWLLHLGLLQV